MLFIFIFSLAIAGVTIIELPIVIILLRSPALIVFFISKNRKIFLTITGACLLALISRQTYQRRYDFKTDNFPLSTGIISEVLWSGKYLYKSQSQDYLLYSTKVYKPEDQIRLVARNSIKPENIQPLASIKLEAVFYSGFNWQKRSKMKWYSNILYETNSILTHTWTTKWFVKVRYWLQQKIQETYTNNRTAWLVLGILIWDKSKFTKSEYQLFIDSGLVHLIAVSGWNIVMLVTFLTAILFFVPFYARIILILLAVLSYWIICWMDSSVLRAVLMGLLSLFALLVWRWSSLRRLLGLVHVGMLVYNPYFLVYDVWYLLSFSAVLGIVFVDVFKLDPKKNSQIKPIVISHCKCKNGNPLLINLFNRIRSSYLKPSLWATLGIFPVIIFFMGKINIAWIIWNIFVLPLVPFIMIGWFIGVFLPSRVQKYYTTFIDIMVARNYKIAGFVDQYGIVIVTDSPLFKFLLFFISVGMMTLTIWTLTKKELAKTKDDSVARNLDIKKTSKYDEILNHLVVETYKKP